MRDVGVWIRLLGGFEVYRDGSLVGPGPQTVMPRSLLVVLALRAGAVVSKGSVVDLLWDGPPASARNVVEKYVSLWRKVLDPGRLQTVGAGYRLSLSAEESDLGALMTLLERGRQARRHGDEHAAAEALGEAHALWDVAGLHDLDEVLLPEPDRQRLVDLYLQTVQEWAAAALACGRAEDVTEPLRQALERHPYWERLAELMLWALFQQGRATEAGEVYRRVRRRLAADLGSDPGPALEEMHVRVLRGDPTLLPGAPADERVVNLPPRNPRFTGREEAMAELGRRLGAPSGGGTRAVAVFGGVGIGKTALALEHAHRHLDDYDCLWWVHAGTQSATTDGLEALAVRLGCTLAEDAYARFEPLWAALRRRRRWLVVFDDAGESSIPHDHWPVGAGGDVVVTSLDPDWGTRASVMELEVLTRAETVRLLASATGSDGGPQDVELAVELGGLPLATVQAAAYIGQTGMSAEAYLPLFRRRRAQLLLRGVPDDHSSTLETTWRLASAELAAAAPAAIQLLHHMAFFAPEALPLSVLRSGADLLPPELRDAMVDELVLQDTIGAIRRFSLLGRTGDHLQMHTLVQAVVAAAVPSEEAAAIRRRVSLLLVAAEPSSATARGSWPAWQLLVPHVVVAAGWAVTEDGPPPEGFLDLLHRTSAYLVGRASYDEARALLEWALSLAERATPGDELEVGRTLTELGEVLGSVGDLGGAIDCQERALAILQRSCGTDDPWTARAASRLSNALTCHHGVTTWSTSELAEADARFEQSVAVLEAALGADHPAVAHGLSGWGQICQDRGDLLRGRQLQERALGILEEAYGFDHPDVGHLHDKLAYVLGLQRDFASSRDHYRRALEILERAHGVGHVETGWTLSNLSMLLLECGEVDEALSYQHQARAVFEAGQAERHPSLIAAWRTARIELRAGHADAAEEILDVVVPQLAAELGTSHPDVLAAGEDLRRALARTSTATVVAGHRG